jgi:hypothetical protein
VKSLKTTKKYKKATTMKGKTNNPNGRPKGKPNKVSTDLRKWINDFIDDNRTQIKKDWLKLDPKDRITLFEKLLKYSLPTLQSTSMDISFEKMTDEQLDAVIDRLIEKHDEQ